VMCLDLSMQSRTPAHEEYFDSIPVSHLLYSLNQICPV
jgi:hypothetical protein